MGTVSAVKFAWWPICFMLLLPLAAQDFAGPEVPGRPDGQLLDEADLFSREPERAAELSRRLERFTDETGYPVYVAFFDTLIVWNLEELTHRLEEAWLDRGPGLVFVVEADAGRWRLGWVDSPEIFDDDGRRMEARSDLDLGGPDKLAIRNRLRDAGPMKPTSADDGFRRVEILLDGLREAHEPIDDAPRKRERQRLGALIAGLVAGVLLLGMLGSAGLRRIERREKERFVFPEIEVGKRLGAPRGGGKLRSRSFR